MIYILNLFTSCFEMRVLNFHGFRRQAPLALQANPNTAGFDQTTRKYKHAPNFGQIQEVTRKTSSNGSPGIINDQQGKTTSLDVSRLFELRGLGELLDVLDDLGDDLARRITADFTGERPANPNQPKAPLGAAQPVKVRKTRSQRCPARVLHTKHVHLLTTWCAFSTSTVSPCFTTPKPTPSGGVEVSADFKHLSCG